MPSQFAFFNLILALVVSCLCDAFVFVLDPNDKARALKAIGKIKTRLTWRINYNTHSEENKYMDRARKFAKEKANSLLEIIEKRAENLVIHETLKLDASEMAKYQYQEYKQLWLKSTLREIAKLHQMIVEHKHDDSVNELFTGNKYTPDAQITFLRKQFQLLYGDLEREYIKNCEERQKIANEYAMFALHDHLNKVIEDVSRLLSELLQKMEILNSAAFEVRRFSIWALVEEVVKQLLAVKEQTTNELQTQIRLNAAEFLFVYEQLRNVSGIGMFDIGMKYNLERRKRFAMKWLEGTLDNVENLNFMPKGGKAVQPLPLHFGELIYNELTAQQESGKRN